MISFLCSGGLYHLIDILSRNVCPLPCIYVLKFNMLFSNGQIQKGLPGKLSGDLFPSHTSVQGPEYD